MYEIDRQKFGAFVAGLRREKGYTQKELAERLYISDKAVSKWETGASIPDTALLVPLSELLGVSVTELLMCGKMVKEERLEAGQVETIVKTVISYRDDQAKRAYQRRSRWPIRYAISFLAGCGGMILNYAGGRTFEMLLTLVLLSAVFGAYFCFFVKVKLPSFYDENRVSVFCDGVFQMSMPGMEFNNKNWPHVVNGLRRWACLSMILYPVLHYILGNPEWGIMRYAGSFVLLFAFLGSLFGTIYAAEKKAK